MSLQYKRKKIIFFNTIKFYYYMMFSSTNLIAWDAYRLYTRWKKNKLIIQRNNFAKSDKNVYRYSTYGCLSWFLWDIYNL